MKLKSIDGVSHSWAKLLYLVVKAPNATTIAFGDLFLIQMFSFVIGLDLRKT